MNCERWIEMNVIGCGHVFLGSVLDFLRRDEKNYGKYFDHWSRFPVETLKRNLQYMKHECQLSNRDIFSVVSEIDFGR